MSAEIHPFQAEVKRLLDLMIHSLYSHKDVFLRELISNASDALDRLRFEGLTRSELVPHAELSIRLVADPEARTLTIEDNGIGMTRDEVVENLGTLARSGTLEFLRTLEPGKDAAPELIGQFGVGFYASFMVADEVTVVTRKAGSDQATRWVSKGEGSFSLEECSREHPGTTIELRLKPVDEEAGIADFTQEWVLRSIVKRYSDFVAYPIRLELRGAEKTADADKPLNSMKAIWTRPPSEVSEEEYAEFYGHVAHDHRPPLLHLSTRIEGNFEARALLYIPSFAPLDLYHRDMVHRGIQLYVRRVFIMDECRELMPEYLRFVKGVVDAEDLSLNVSREMLQQDRQVRTIRNHLVKKILETLQDLKQNDPEKYLAFWAQFGPVLKEGLLGFDDKRERILDLLLCASTHDESRLTSLADYVCRMASDQEPIYYATGASRERLAASPHLEAFRQKGIAVQLFGDPVDEVWLQQMPPEYQGRRFQSVGRGEIELGSEEARKQDEETYKNLLACLRSAVQDQVKEVRLSSRLTHSPSCLILDEGALSPHIEAMLRQAGQEVPRQKPILEINPAHPILQKLQELFEKDGTDPRLRDYARLLYGQAVLAEGGQLEDPATFTRDLCELMLKAL